MSKKRDTYSKNDNDPRLSPTRSTTTSPTRSTTTSPTRSTTTSPTRLTTSYISNTRSTLPSAASNIRSISVLNNLNRPTLRTPRRNLSAPHIKPLNKNYIRIPSPISPLHQSPKHSKSPTSTLRTTSPIHQRSPIANLRVSSPMLLSSPVRSPIANLRVSSPMLLSSPVRSPIANLRVSSPVRSRSPDNLRSPQVNDSELFSTLSSVTSNSRSPIKLRPASPILPKSPRVNLRSPVKSQSLIGSKSSENMDECCICMDPVTKLSKCGHGICQECIKKLHKEECPVCRQKLEGGYFNNQTSLEIKLAHDRDKRIIELVSMLHAFYIERFQYREYYSNIEDEARIRSEAFGPFIEQHLPMAEDEAIRIFFAFVIFITTDMQYFKMKNRKDKYDINIAMKNFDTIGNIMLIDPSASFEDLYDLYLSEQL